jgi:hypothetical protein
MQPSAEPRHLDAWRLPLVTHCFLPVKRPPARSRRPSPARCKAAIVRRKKLSMRTQVVDRIETMYDNPYEAPRNSERAPNAQSPKSTTRYLIVLVVASLILVSEVLVVVVLYGARVMASSEPARFGSWEPVVGSDAVVFFLAPLLAAITLAVVLARSLPLRAAAAYCVGFSVATILSFVALLAAMTIAFNKWGM